MWCPRSAAVAPTRTHRPLRIATGRTGFATAAPVTQADEASPSLRPVGVGSGSTSPMTLKTAAAVVAPAAVDVDRMCPL